MHQAKIAIDGTLPSALAGRARKRAFPPQYQAWIAGLALLISLPPIGLLLVAELAPPPAVSQTPRDAALPPAGTWHCTLGSEAVGRLRVEGWHYTLTTEAGDQSDGLLTPVGGQALKNRAAYVRVASGVLKEDFGANLGIHDDYGSPEALILNNGPGSGIRCVRN